LLGSLQLQQEIKLFTYNRYCIWSNEL